MLSTTPAAPRAALRPALTILVILATVASTGCDDTPRPVSPGYRVPVASNKPSPAPAPANGTATLRWTAPTETSDGGALKDLAGYRVYYGQATFRLDRNVTLYDPAATMTVVNNLGSGTWFFSVTAFTGAGAESLRSNVVSKYIP